MPPVGNITQGVNTKIYDPELSNIRDGVEIGDNSVLHSHIWIGENVKIGNNVRIQAFSFIPEGVIIEDDVFIGPRVTFTNDKYPPSSKEEWKPTIVKRGASIGASVTILPGITIGEGARIGAGAVVTKNVEPYTVVCGNPATPRAGIKR